MTKHLIGLTFVGLLALGVACGSDMSPSDSDDGIAGAGTGGAGSGGGSQSGSGGKANPPTPVEPAEVLPCFADEGTPAGDAIQLAVVVNRLKGVAPLSVFFDTEGTTAEATTRPYHDLAYCWDFGDEDAGAFATTGLSKNQGRGPTVGHVYEAPGTYTVTVSARDAEGRVVSSALEIEVEDPDEVFAGENTVCVSGAGDFDDCPAGAATVTTSSIREVQDYVAPGRRILLHRGEEYTGGLSINVQGPGTVGAYGPADEARPKVAASGTVFRISNAEPDFSDWRIMDMDLEGNGDGNTGGVAIGGKATDLLVLRMRAVGIAEPVKAPDSVLDYYNNNGSPGHDAVDGLTIVDSELTDIVGGDGRNATYAAAHRLLILGTIYRNSTEGEHLLRTPWIDRGWIASNTFAETPAPRLLIKMHGPPHSDSTSIGYQKYTERVVVSDNVFEGSGGHDLSVGLGPKNETSDERLRDIIIERNLFLPGPDVIAAIAISLATDVTIRENLLNRGSQEICITSGGQGVAPPAARIAVNHNTCYTEGERMLLARLSSAESVAFNNLAIGANVEELEIRGAESQGGNLLLSPDNIETAPPLDADDFALSADSAAIDAADETLWTPWDYHGRATPIDGDESGEALPDVGALEYVP